jgi:hypothetical protein
MEGPAGMLVAVTNPAPTRQGSDRPAPAPSLTDERNLRTGLMADLETTALEELRGRLQPGQRLLQNSLRIKHVSEESREPKGQTAADVLQMTIRAEYEAWVVEEKDLQAVSLAALDATLEKGFQAVPASLRFSFTGEVVIEESGSSAGGRIARGELKVDRLVEAVVNKDLAVEVVRGQTVADAQQLLQSRLLLADAPQIQMYPQWWSRLPFLPFRITVVRQ